MDKKPIEIEVGKLKPGTSFTWDNRLGFGGWVLKQDKYTTLVKDTGGDGQTYSERCLPNNEKVWTENEVLPKDIWDWLGEFDE